MTAGNSNGPNPRGLYRDTDNGILAGVCAGIADYFGFNLKAIRWLMVISCFFMMPGVILTYLAAAFILKPKPEGMYRDETEESFWRTVRRDPQNVFDDVRHKFRDLDMRLQRMEEYVTSSRFDLDREFKDLQS